jgi:hypothetical protein
VFWGTVGGDDAINDNPRNLNFRSRIGELSVLAEINYLPYFTGSKKDYRFSPYLFGGVAIFTFNPQANYTNPVTQTRRWVDLQPLRTEGQGLLTDNPYIKTYSTTQLAIPFGLGFKYSLNSIFSVGLEWGMRLTFTDYLDDVSGFYADPDVLAMESEMSLILSNRWSGPWNERPLPGSQRGSSNKRDWYSFAGLTITGKIGNARKEPCSAYKVSAMERIRRTMGN